MRIQVKSIIKYALGFISLFTKVSNVFNKKIQCCFFRLKKFVIYRLVTEDDVINFPINKKKSDLCSSPVTWTLWLQGVEEAPDVVKMCIRNYQDMNDRKLIILTERNIADYVDIPKPIVDKYASGIISSTAYSEIIRLECLATYGGLWLDSTMFIPAGIKYDFSSLNFFSPKAKVKKDDDELFGYIAMFFLFCKQDYIPVINVRNRLLSYWVKYDSQFNYFLVDFFFMFEYEKNDYFRHDVDRNPAIGKNMHELESFYLYEAYDEYISDFIKTDPLGAFKLNYKVKYPLLDSSGNETLYSKIINDEI